MDTNRAKNITIAFLLLLNLVLFGCNFAFSDFDRYRITAQAKENIIEVLGINNITFADGADFSRDYAPMAILETQLFVYDIQWLRGVFLKDAEAAEFSAEDDRRVYRSETESLSVNLSTGFVVYRDRTVSEFVLPDTDLAEELAEGLADKIKSVFGDFYLDIPPYITEEGLIFEYRQSYRDYTVNSNYLIITVNADVISRAEFMCARPIGFSREVMDITPPDEALITCMHEIKNLYGERGAVIEQISLVYHHTEYIYAEPHYRIRLAKAPLPILVNAYTNAAVYDGG